METLATIAVIIGMLMIPTILIYSSYKLGY